MPWRANLRESLKIRHHHGHYLEWKFPEADYQRSVWCWDLKAKILWKSRRKGRPTFTVWMAWWQHYLPRKWLFFWEGSQESLLELHSCRDDFVGIRNGLIIVWMLHRGIWFEAGKRRQMGRVHIKQRTLWLCKFLILFFSSLGHIPANRKWSTIATEVLWGIWSGVYILVLLHQKVGSFIATWCLSQVSTCTWKMIRFFWCFWWKGFQRNFWGADCQKLFGCISRAVFKGFSSESSRSIHFQWKHQWFLNTSRPLNLRICIIYEDGAVIVGTVDGQRLGLGDDLASLKVKAYFQWRSVSFREGRMHCLIGSGARRSEPEGCFWASTKNLPLWYGSNSLGEVDSRNLEIQIHLSFHIWSFKFFLLRNKLCCQASLTQKSDSDIFSWQKKWWGQNSIGLCGMVTRWQEHFVLHFERWGDGVFVRRWRCINPRCEQWMLRITSIVPLHRCMSTTMKGFIPTRFQSTVCHGLFWSGCMTFMVHTILGVGLLLQAADSFHFRWQVWIVVPKEQWPLLALTGLLDLVVQTIRRTLTFINSDTLMTCHCHCYDTIDHHDGEDFYPDVTFDFCSLLKDSVPRNILSWFFMVKGQPFDRSVFFFEFQPYVERLNPILSFHLQLWNKKVGAVFHC